MNKIENLVFEYFSKIITDALDRVRAQDTDPNHKHMDYEKRNAFQHAYVSGYIANLLGEVRRLGFNPTTQTLLT